jgi:uncharacterized protein with NAD-binding domain and iron-sulfur cluster
MSLKPEASVMSGLAVAAVVFAIHSNFTPSVADMQGLPAGNKDVDKSERQATWLSAGIVAGISLLAKDPTIFVLGSIATVALAFTSRHAVWTDSTSGMVNAGPGQSAVSANDTATGPAMSDTQAYTMYSTSDFVSS